MMDHHPFFAKYTGESDSTVHHTLRASRRRLTIIILTRVVGDEWILGQNVENEENNTDIDRSLPVREVARKIVAIEQDIAVEHATGDDYHNVYTALIQTHLPRLDQVGAVEYDEDRKVVKPGRNLLAFAAVTSITAPVTELMFNEAADHSRGGEASTIDSITN